MDHRCDCERGGNCTRTTMCHVQSVVDDLNGEHEIEIERLQRELDLEKTLHLDYIAELQARVDELESKLRAMMDSREWWRGEALANSEGENNE